MSDPIIRANAEKDPRYAPYCGPCPGLVRMVKVAPFQWKCARCGARHDERTDAERDVTPPRAAGDGR